MPILTRIARHYRQQWERYKNLAALTENLLPLVENAAETVEAIGTVISERQKLLNEIEAARAKAEPLWQALEQELGYLPQPLDLPKLFTAEAALEIAQMHKKIETTIRQVMADDAKIQAALSTTIKKVQRQMQNMHQERQAARSYTAGQKQSLGIFLDFKKY
ncbi:MAG: hypothetical protein GX197_01965 [Firmicutes bacterium]|nr:hypothetical protein [Bacillota bacterium]